jgi:hypothetical protein
LGGGFHPVTVMADDFAGGRQSRGSSGQARG